MSKLNVSTANIYPNLCNPAPSAPPEPRVPTPGIFPEISSEESYIKGVFVPNPVPVTALMRCLLQGSRQGDPDAMQMLSAFSVTIQQIPLDANNQGGAYFHHDPLPFKVLKEIKQACTQYGTHSHYTVGLVEGLPRADHLIPWNWEMLARTVLSSTEFLQFKALWTNEATMIAWQNIAHNPPILITTEQLLGVGEWSGVQRQLQYDDQAITQVHNSCLGAWRRISAPGKPTQSFLKVIQGVNETYVARLTNILIKTIEIPEARDLVLVIMNVKKPFDL